MDKKVRSVIKPKQAVYKIEGTLAALVKEEVWEQLLKGKAVGVIEPDASKWSLYQNGRRIETITEFSQQGAVEAFAKRNLEFNADCLRMCADERPLFVWEVESGYPNVIALTPADLARHERDGMDAKKLAKRMRELIRVAHSKMHLMAAVEEQLVHGAERQGKD